jgi:hypothetical protein
MSKKNKEDVVSDASMVEDGTATIEDLINPLTLKALAEIAKEKERLRGRALEDVSPHERFASVRSEVKVLAKGGVNSHSNYKYAREADIVAQVNLSCESHGLYYIIEYSNAQYSIVERKDKVSVRASVDCRLVLIDVFSGKIIHSNTACGDALDTGDKAIFKAQTGAKKYAMMAMFGIATFDDPEAESPTIGDAKLNADPLKRFVYRIPRKKYEASEKLRDYLEAKKYKLEEQSNWLILRLSVHDISLNDFKEE